VVALFVKEAGGGAEDAGLRGKGGEGIGGRIWRADGRLRRWKELRHRAMLKQTDWYVEGIKN